MLTNVVDNKEYKFIHLLYAPTNFCNMGCQYCYLGKGTDELTQKDKVVDTLKFALSEFIKNKIIPFNLSFHGGEATAVPKSLLQELFQIAKQHYQNYAAIIKSNNYPLNPIHIKTNII